MNEIGITLVWCGVQVTLIGLVAAGFYVVARRIGPAAGSLVAMTSLLVIVALSALAFSPWPHWPVALWAASAEAPSVEPQREAAPNVPSVESRPPSAERAISDRVASAPDVRQTDRAAPTAVLWQAFLAELSATSSASEVPQRRWTTIVAILFFVAVGAGFLWVLIGLVAVRSCRLRSRRLDRADLLELVDLLRAELGCRRPIELREADGLVTATTFGWRRPVILLPAEWTDWTPVERRAVLAHEIAHIRHNDFLACLGGQLGLALHFYHPLVHWLVGRLRLEQELAADATAAGVAGGKVTYLKTLAEIALRQEDRFVGWPARAFLPTRNTFLRRIEMLRHSRESKTSLSAGARVLTVGVLVSLGLIVAGLRGPAQDPAALAADPLQADAGSTTADTGQDLSCVSPQAIGLLSIRPAEILRQPDFRKLAGFLNKEIEHEMDLPLEKIEQITWVSLAFAPSPGTPARPWTLFDALVAWVLPFDGGYLIVRTSDPKDSKSTTKLVTKNPRRQRFGEQTYYLSRTTTAGGRLGYCRTDDRTIVIAAEPVLKLFPLERRGGVPRFAKGPIWKQIEKDPLIVAVDVQRYLEQVPAADRGEIPPTAAAFSPLWEDATTVALGVGIDGQLRIRGAATCKDEESAKRWQETLQAARVLGRNASKQLRSTLGASAERPSDMLLAVSAMNTLEGLLDGLRVRQQGRIVRLQTAARFDVAQVPLLAEALHSAQGDAQRVQSLINLKQIGLAMLMYSETHGTYPPAASYDPNGKPLLSWRVHILPYLEGETFYREFHLDEPWDSPHNIKLLPRIPSGYRSPSGKEPGKYHSSYFVLTGPETVFPGKTGVKISEIRDGTSNTILAVEARRAVPWTKPEDIPYDSGKPLPEFIKDGFRAVFCDGSAHIVTPSANVLEPLRTLIEKADGKRVDQNLFMR